MSNETRGQLATQPSPASSTDTISVAQDTTAPSALTDTDKPLPSTSTPRGSSVAPWAARLSTSFSVIAEQLTSASQALAAVPPSPSTSVSLSTENGDAQQWQSTDLASLAIRLDKIERSQAELGAQIEALKSQCSQAQIQSNEQAPTLENLEKRINEVMDAVKLDNDRLYARLRNATVTVSKMPILAPPTAGGKPPQNFPATKGEFEHLTKERYEAILKAYGQPIKGDTNAKRQALRVFIGLPA